MAFEEVSHVQHALQELQGHNVLDGLNIHVVAGTTANTDISLPGIKTTDKIAFVISSLTSQAILGVATGMVNITADDIVQTTSNTTGFQLIVAYYSDVIPA